MSKVLETGLIIRKETSIEKLRRILYRVFFKEEYFLEMEINNIIKSNKPNPRNIVIPKEIKIEKYKRL